MYHSLTKNYPLGLLFLAFWLLAQKSQTVDSCAVVIVNPPGTVFIYQIKSHCCNHSKE